MTKREASIKYYYTLFKLVEIFLLIGVDLIVVIPLYFEKYYAFSGLFIAFNILAIKVWGEYLKDVKEKINFKELKPEDKKEAQHLFLEALLEGVRTIVFISAILIGIILYGINLIESDIIRIFSIVAIGLLTRICSTIFLDKIRENYLQM